MALNLEGKFAVSIQLFFSKQTIIVSRAKKETILQVNRLTKIGVYIVTKVPTHLTAVFGHKKMIWKWISYKFVSKENYFHCILSMILNIIILFMILTAFKCTKHLKKDYWYWQLFGVLSNFFFLVYSQFPKLQYVAIILWAWMVK